MARADHSMITAWSESFPQPMAETKAPARLVIRRDIRDGVGLIGKREEVRRELVESEPLVDRSRISDHMQVVLRKIDDAAPALVLEKALGDLPFWRHAPI